LPDFLGASERRFNALEQIVESFLRGDVARSFVSG
jgi:hypothetical protein